MAKRKYQVKNEVGEWVDIKKTPKHGQRYRVCDPGGGFCESVWADPAIIAREMVEREGEE